MKYILYTLYGNLPRYTQPLIYNINEVKKIYPGWKVRIYHDDSVLESTLELLQSDISETVNIKNLNIKALAPKFWRFIPIFENEKIEFAIIRDSDSILTIREAELVSQWVNSEYTFHILRDHPLHVSPILAGMFGVKRSNFKLFSEFYHNQNQILTDRTYNADQKFLSKKIYPNIIDNALIHTSAFYYSSEKNKRLISKDETNFIGKVHTHKTGEENYPKYLKYNILKGVPYSWAKFINFKTSPIILLSKLIRLKC